jgi:hypothetical protein
MPTDGRGDEPRQTLQAVLDALDVGDWAAVLHPDPARPSGRPIAGSRKLIRLAVLPRITARSMQLQSQGDVFGAWERLAEAARRLPTWYSSAADRARAALRLPPRGPDVEAEVAWRVARVIWREQYELDDLRRRFARGLMTPREQLVQACIEHLVWVDFDPYCRCGAQDGDLPPDRSRASLCLRGSRLRQFADPHACDISQSVWRDIGAFPGLCAEALDRLADRPAPAPWHGVAGAADLHARRGRLRAWNHALTRRDDLNYWK